jgi:hypothetical protein
VKLLDTAKMEVILFVFIATMFDKVCDSQIFQKLRDVSAKNFISNANAIPGRRKPGDKLEVSSTGLEVQNMPRTYKKVRLHAHYR